MGEFAWVYGSLCAAAFAAGAVNAVAGGGTLLTFPTLLFALAPRWAADAGKVANATSTVALVPGSLAGAWGYRRELRGSGPWLLLLLAPSLLGGVAGALLMVLTGATVFDRVIPWLLLTASLLFLAQPYLALHFPPHPETGQASLPVRAGVVFFQFLVAVYGGYFGAGIGILMLTSLAFMGIGDIHRVNGVKTILAAVINGVSIVIFVIYNTIDWRYAPVMAVASILGGYYGAVIGRRIPKAVLRGFIVAVGLTVAAYYFLKQGGVI